MFFRKQLLTLQPSTIHSKHLQSYLFTQKFLRVLILVFWYLCSGTCVLVLAFWYLCSSDTKLCSSKEKEIMSRPVFYYTIQELLSRDVVVGIVTGLWSRQVGDRVPARSIFFSPRKHPEWLWAPPSLLYGRYQGYYLGCQVTRAWGWPNLRIHGTILPLRGPG